MANCFKCGEEVDIEVTEAFFLNSDQPHYICDFCLEEKDPVGWPGTKYLTPESCASYLVDQYKDCPEKLLWRLARQFDFAACGEKDPEKRKRLIKVFEAMEKLSNQIKEGL